MNFDCVQRANIVTQSTAYIYLAVHKNMSNAVQC